MYELPMQVTINNRKFNIRNNGDYRMVLDCFAALGDIELDNAMRVLSSLVIFYEDAKSIEDIAELFGENINIAVEKMYLFFNCGQKQIGATSPHKLIDWEQDEPLITSAINNVTKTEIRLLPYLHWWTFVGYYLSIGECPLSTVVSIRSKIQKHKKLEKYEQEFRRDNPEYFIWNSNTVDENDAIDTIMKAWNS